MQAPFHEQQVPLEVLLENKISPSNIELKMLSERIFNQLPQVILDHLKNVIIQWEEFPDDEIAETMELVGPYDLLGLYKGVDLPSQGAIERAELPDIIYLYRRPVLDYWCESGETLGDIVRNVLIHEIGHHFGLSDELMARIKQASESTLSP